MGEPFWKEEPVSEDVHVLTTEWTLRNKRKKKPIDKADRKLDPIDGRRSATPFPYVGNILGTLREDQVPRFFGALTNPEGLTEKKVNLDDLTAMQNRVDTAKVKAIAEADPEEGAALPVVIQHDGKKWIADGHHRLAAAWLRGEGVAQVRFKNLEPVMNTMKRDGQPKFSAIAKVDEGLGLVFGWAIVCKVNGEPYFDTQGDHVPEDVMLRESLRYMKGARVAGKMHEQDGENGAVCYGQVPFAWPATEEVQDAFGESATITGLKIGMLPDDPEMIAKFKSGEFTGFSIGGFRVVDEPVED